MKNTKELEPKKIYTVSVEWVNECGDHGNNTYLFNTLAKAEEQLRKESLTELETLRGYEIYCEEECCDKDFIKSLFDKFNDDFNHVENENFADYVIEASPTYFCCYKQGSYVIDHIVVQINEQEVK